MVSIDVMVCVAVAHICATVGIIELESKLEAEG